MRPILIYTITYSEGLECKNIKITDLNNYNDLNLLLHLWLVAEWFAVNLGSLPSHGDNRLAVLLDPDLFLLFTGRRRRSFLTVSSTPPLLIGVVRPVINMTGSIIHIELVDVHPSWGRGCRTGVLVTSRYRGTATHPSVGVLAPQILEEVVWSGGVDDVGVGESVESPGVLSNVIQPDYFII